MKGNAASWMPHPLLIHSQRDGEVSERSARRKQSLIGALVVCALGFIFSLLSIQRTHAAEPALVGNKARTSSAANSAEKRALTLSLISPRGVEQTREDWSGFVADMELKLKRPIVLRIGKNQAEVVADMVEQRADIAWLGNAPALEIVESGKGEVFASMVRTDGGTGYRSVIITRKDSPIKSLAELLDPARQITFGIGDTKSTSGYVIPNYYIFARNNVAPEKVFKKLLTGNHQENALRAAKGEVDAAVCNDAELVAVATRFPVEAAQLRVIWKSVEIPESPVMWQRTLDSATKTSVRKFFIEYGNGGPNEAANLQRMNGLSRFRISSNRQLLAIADIEMFNARTRIDADVGLSPTERSRKNQDVVARAVRLESALRMK